MGGDFPETLEAMSPVYDKYLLSEIPPAVESDQNVVDLLAEADFYVQQGLLEEGKKIYRKIISLNPENTQAQLKLAEIATEEELNKEIEAISLDSSKNESISQTESEKKEEPVGVSSPAEN